jgi:TolA-binding protein
MTSRSQRGNNKTSSDMIDLSITSAGSAQLDDASLDRFEVILIKVTRSMSESFNSSIAQLMKLFDDKVQLKLDVQANELFQLNVKLDALSKSNEELRKENLTLRQEIKNQENQIQSISSANEELEQYSRVDNMLIHGVPAPQPNTQENLYTLIPEILNRNFENLNLSSEHISIAHRLPPPRPQSATSASSRQTPPPIIVKFTRRVIRNNLLANKKSLKGRSISISEHLSPRRASLLKKASTLVLSKKIGSAWSQEGKILVKTLQNHILPILCEQDLEQFA